MLLRSIVSKKKKRYKEDGFNLDLTYICPNIIAMGFPAKNLEGVYRNHIDDVIKFLKKKHNDKYKIYNLCEEKKYQYDSKKFQNCALYPFSDHNPPNIELIQEFCKDVDDWIKTDSENIAAIHCKAGKGRTGTMICCYLLYSQLFKKAVDALNFYGQARTSDMKGVTIPSQRRYVEYYAQLLEDKKVYEKVAMQICEIRLYNLPSIRGYGGVLTFSIVNSSEGKIHSEHLPSDLKPTDNNEYISIKLDRCVPLRGDVKVEFTCTQIMKHKHKLFHYWFNTFFVNQPAEGSDPDMYVLELKKHEIDDAHKDKQKIYGDDFKVVTYLQKLPPGSYIGTKINNLNLNLESNHKNEYKTKCNNSNSSVISSNSNSNPKSSSMSNSAPKILLTNSNSTDFNNSLLCEDRRVRIGEETLQLNKTMTHSVNDSSNNCTTSQQTISESSSAESSSDSSEGWDSESIVGNYTILEPEDKEISVKNSTSVSSLQSN